MPATSRCGSTAAPAGASDATRDEKPPPTPAAFDRLARTRLYRTLPMELRARVDVAILLRPPEWPRLEDILAGMELETRFGIRLTDLRQYARALEHFARPLMAALLVSTLLGALPRRVSAHLGRANRLLVWSRLVQHLTDPNAKPLTATELAKVAAILRPAARRSGRASGGRQQPAEQRLPFDRDTLAPVVRMLYGVNLADDVPSQAAPQRPEPRPQNQVTEKTQAGLDPNRNPD